MQDGEVIREFRAIPTLAGTGGVPGIAGLAPLAHGTNSSFNNLRNGKRRLESPFTALILASVISTQGASKHA
jgi:chemotaxis protein histidine kinase CheA